jgi:uroporphyrin-III C-methyltransferase
MRVQFRWRGRAMAANRKEGGVMGDSKRGSLSAQGKVYLVGAGPGDPELLTLKAERLLRSADVVLHDDLVSQAVLALVPAGTRVHDVGKRCGAKRITQEEINARLIAFAREGLTVVRLKGGDPLIFGRACEEMDALRQAGIEFAVVPGVTAALAAAAAAQISLTDRQLAPRLLLCSNHRCAGKRADGLREAVPSDTTLAVYMPGNGLEELASELRASGFEDDTPCLLASCAARPQQQVHWTTVAELALAPRFMAPVLLIIGAVAARSPRPTAQEESVGTAVAMRS